VVAAFAARRRCCALEWEQWRECAQRRGNLPQCPTSPDPSSSSKRLSLQLTNVSATITSAAVGGMPHVSGKIRCVGESVDERVPAALTQIPGQ
jgi:hypothetical protein